MSLFRRRYSVDPLYVEEAEAARTLSHRKDDMIAVAWTCSVILLMVNLVAWSLVFPVIYVISSL